MRTLTPLEDRFWPKVLKGGANECWPWIAGTNGVGYGMIRSGGSAPRKLAHRVAYELVNGPIPDGLVLCHACDNPRCVNPKHLWLGTMADNMADKVKKGRARGGSIRGERQHCAKLTDALVEEYRSRLAAGTPVRALARETGLDQKTLTDMRNRVTWKHVP